MNAQTDRQTDATDATDTTDRHDVKAHVDRHSQRRAATLAAAAEHDPSAVLPSLWKTTTSRKSDSDSE